MAARNGAVVGLGGDVWQENLVATSLHLINFCGGMTWLDGADSATCSQRSTGALAPRCRAVHGYGGPTRSQLCIHRYHLQTGPVYTTLR